MTRTRGTGRTRRVGTATLAALLLAGTASGVALASVNGPGTGDTTAGVPRVLVPAGEFVAQCPATPRLVKGTSAEGTDPAFGPASESATTAIRATVLSDAARRLPGAHVLAQDGKELRRISPRLPQAEAGKETATGKSGFTGRSARTVSGLDAPGPALVKAQPLGGLKSVAGAARSYRATDGDLAGLAASRCQSPANEQWLTGASTTVGRTALLLVSNPSQSPSTVDLRLFGEKGEIEAGNSRGIVVAPGETTSIVLAGMAPSERSLAVQVSSTGSPVTAVIQQSVLRGLTPGGVDYIEPAAPAGSQQVISGISVQDPKTTQKISRQGGYDDAVPELHVTVPGAQEQRVRVRVYGRSGEVALPHDGRISAAGRSTTRFPLASLPAGDYTAVLESDDAIVASARLSRGSKPKERVDAAWLPAGERLGSQHLAIVPELAQSKLVFGTPAGESQVELRPVSAKGTVGKAVNLTSRGGTTTVQRLDTLGKDTVAVIVTASGDPVFGGQVITAGKTGISTLAIPPATEGQREVSVDIRY